MRSLIPLLVLLAALMHASWNALIKGSSDQVGTQMLIMAVGTLMAAAAIPWVPCPAPEAWPFIAVSVLALAHTAARRPPVSPVPVRLIFAVNTS